MENVIRKHHIEVEACVENIERLSQCLVSRLIRIFGPRQASLVILQSNVRGAFIFALPIVVKIGNAEQARVDMYAYIRPNRELV